MIFNNTPHDNDDDCDDHSHHHDDNDDDDDHCCYIALEQDDNESTRRFVQEANKFCITALGDPTTMSSSRYPRILNLIRSEDDERIPFVTKMGGGGRTRTTTTTTTTIPDGSGDDGDDEELYNLWKDDKNPRGIWRKTSLSLYASTATDTKQQQRIWTTVLDLDALSIKEKTPWIWRGSRVLPTSRDHHPLLSLSGENGDRQEQQQQQEQQQVVTRVLIFLSRERSDDEDGDDNDNDDDDESAGVVVREFDLVSCQFVADHQKPFSLSNASITTTIHYKTRDVVYVASDFGKGTTTLTQAGFPRTIREWVRGTNIQDAPVIFEGESTDIAVATYLNDQRHRGGNMYEIRSRIVSPGITRHWARKVKNVQEPSPVGLVEEFKELQVPPNAEIDFVGNVLLIVLRSDWHIANGDKKKIFKKGSILYVNTHKFLKYGPQDRIYHTLFQPKANSICNDYIVTKQFLILSISEGAHSGLDFYRLEKDANKLRLVFKEEKTLAQTINIRPVDAYAGDKFWLSTTSFLQPLTLFLADASNVEDTTTTAAAAAAAAAAADKSANGVAGYIERQLHSLSNQFDASDVVVQQMVAQSKDGTKIPYFVIFNKELVKEKKRNPTLLCADGSLNNCPSPSYAALPGLAWIERGGVYVEAHIRGGTGVADSHNQSCCPVVDDFLAVAEDLVNSKICSAKSLTIRGGSGGALVVLQAYLMRPDLFAAVSCVSPVTDLKRVDVLGCPDPWKAAAVDFNGENSTTLFSPFHNLDKSVKKYPPILFTTVENASVVHPGHSRKMVKRSWNEGLGKKWPTFYFESVSSPQTSVQEQYAFITALAYDFLFKKASKST